MSRHSLAMFIHRPFLAMVGLGMNLLMVHPPTLCYKGTAPLPDVAKPHPKAGFRPHAIPQ